ncbi:excinuclease ABC subunit C [candidate division TA06 bacterium B3_TA06]|uniref:UvrABC system protein C n=1 Tax=candidate division TA06 bacterium B3_TA06 TaxID=2012487 RepID=A0A532VAQ5_UNCT6|nr:MAG: excinuclease ABC subunit C [candidate division TA06 bacterium B3_TA06]
MIDPAVRERINAAPHKPGVYVFKDARNRVLYVGKASDLANRLHSYLSPTEPKTRAFVDKAALLDLTLTATEAEALIYEENLIKLSRPRYNIRYRDDKRYPYLKVTVKEAFPRIFVTRNERRDGSLLFGPYSSAKNLKRTLDAVKRIFKIRTCHYDLPQDHPERPCLLFQLKLCSAPCQKGFPKEEYANQLKGLIDFLMGHSEKLEEETERRMWETSEAEQFEVAALLRDQLLAIREVKRYAKEASQDATPRDFIAVARHASRAAAVLLKLRERRMYASETFMLTVPPHTSDADLIHTVLRFIYTHTYDVPDEIVLPLLPEDPEVFIDWFAHYRDKKVKLSANVREEKRHLLGIADENAKLALVQDAETTRTDPLLIKLQEYLHLPATPQHIEMIDISNIQGTNPTGSIVVFKNSCPAKSHYRKFKIKTVEGANDPAMMAEVVARRVNRLQKEGKSLPDLLILDGGKSQLSVVRELLNKIDVDLSVFAFAKTHDHLFGRDGKEVVIPGSEAVLKLLKRIRNESHRFAVTYHRKLRFKAGIASELDAIPGVGPKRAKDLVQFFGSVPRIRKASIEELRAAPGIGPALAETIYRHFHKG